MPVTTYPSPQVVGRNKNQLVQSSEQLLVETSRSWTIDPAKDGGWGAQTNKKRGPETRSILRSSFEGAEGTAKIIPHQNGLVMGIIQAFQQDLHLVLRPDDVWLCILSQFSMFVNGKAEELRSQFVAHEGKKKLEVDVTPESLWQVELGKVFGKFTDLIQQNVLDPQLQEWIMPNFTTTTAKDKSVAAVVMMATMKHYFEYVMLCGCGFPSVTLLGEKSDWEVILQKVERLPKFGEEPTEWAKLLTAVVKSMISTFDAPDSEATKEFWLRVCHEVGVDGSLNYKTMSGWLTAFCYWDEEGNRINDLTPPPPAHEKISEWVTSLVRRKQLILDGVKFPIIRPKDIPASVVTAPVTVIDFGSRLQYETTVVAGLLGMSISQSTSVNGDVVKPQSGWWMLQDSVKPFQ